MNTQIMRHITGIIVGMRSAHERRRYDVKLFVIGWIHTQNEPYIFAVMRGILNTDLEMNSLLEL